MPLSPSCPMFVHVRPCVSPGSAFFLPHGQRIYNTLLHWLRQEYRQRGYDEVSSPILYHQSLWERSGHWEHYKENMFLIGKGEGETETASTPASTSVPTSAPTATPAPASASTSTS